MRTTALPLALAVTIAVTACGPCGDVKRIGLEGEPQAQVGQDRAMLQRYWSRYDQPFSISIDLEEMAKHRDAGRVLVRSGYLQPRGKKYAFTSKARAQALGRQSTYYTFSLETTEHRTLPPFIAAYETVACNETHEFERVYAFDEYLGPLTPIAKALQAQKLLYYWRDDFLIGLDGKSGFRPRRWRGRHQPLYEIWSFSPGVGDSPGLLMGERLGFEWQYSGP